MRTIKGFIFDMDGVLTETSENHFFAWKALAKSIGIEIDRHINEQLKGISRQASLEVILRSKRKENDFTPEEKEKLMTEKNNAYVEMINQFDQSNLLPGVYAMLEALNKKGIKVAIASASRSAEMLSRLMNIEQFVDYIVDPTTVPGKPEPDIFIKAAQGLGLIPTECVGVEDAVAGIEAIKSAGMFAVGIGSSSQLSKADIVYDTPIQMDIDGIILLAKLS